MRSKLCCALAGLAGSLVGCADPADDAEVTRGYALLATVDLPEGGTLEFGEQHGGGIITMEDAPIDAPSVMNYYARRYDATPLEVFTALAPDADVPPALVAAHAAQAATEHRASAEPRRLPPPPAIDKSTTNADYQWYYAADCSLAEDGGWFDDFWQTYSWGYHWYWRTTAYENFSPEVGGNNIQIHMCNDGGATYKTLQIMERDGDVNCAPGNWHNLLVVTEVAPQHRRQFRVTNDPLFCYYRADGSNKTGYQNLPWWNMGVTKP